MPTTPRCPSLPVLLLAIITTSLAVALMPTTVVAEEILTIGPELEGEPIDSIHPVELSVEELTLPLREMPSASTATPFSLGDYSHLPPLSAPTSAQKAVDLLNADFDITSGVIGHSEPDVAYNSTNGDYLVVYVRSSGGATGADIYGQRVSAAGVPTGSPFAIFAEPENASRPRVIYNPVSNEFMVVAYLAGASSHFVVSRVVPATGLPTAMIFDPFALFTDANYPDVAYNASSAEYLVVSGRVGQDSILMRRLAVGHGTPQGGELEFRESDGVADAAPSIVVYPTTGEYVIFSERISGAFRGVFGYIVPSNVASVSVLTGFTVGVNSYAPRIAADTGRGEIFMAWQLATDATDTIFNTAIGPVNFATGAVGSISAITTAATDDRRPRVVYQSTEDDFLVTWSRAGATSQPLAAIVGGTTAGAQQNNTSSAVTTTMEASVAINGSDSLQVWTENSVPSQIRGRLLGTAAPSLSVNPTSLDFGTSTTSLGLALTNTGTGSLIWGTTAPLWVTRTPGTDSFFTSQNITIGVNRAGLPPGTYNTTLTFLVPAATDVDVPITMTIPNTPPTAPANPSPASGASDQPLAFTLDWTSSDPDVGQILVHDLYLSTDQTLVDGLDASVRLGSDFTNSFADVSGLGNLTTYYWRIVAKDGVTATAGPTWSFSTARVGMTTLTPMADPINDSTPTFQWSVVAGAASYELRVGTDPDLGNIALIVGGLTGTSHTPTTPLGDNEYFWTVITVAPNGTESFSPSVNAFTIDTMAPGTPTLNAVGSPTANARPALSWSASAGASSYSLQAATDVGFSNLVIDETPIGTSFTPVSDLPEGTIYWRVAANDAAGNQSAFTAAGSFEIDQTAPAAPVLIAVPDPTGDARQAMSWNASAGAATYRIQVSTDAAFATTLFDESALATTSFTPTSGLPENTIYWRVLATDAAANASAFSAVDSFDVDLTAPAVPTLNALLPDPTNNPRPELTWLAVAGAAEYALQVADTAFLHGGSQPESALIFNGVVSGTSWIVGKGDLPEGPIYWRLASRDDVGNQSAFSAADDFVIDVTPPAIPTLTPVSPDPTADTRPALTWSAETDAVAYRVQVSTDSGFATTLHDVSIAATTYTPGSDLPEGTIYWRVASRDVAENDSEFAAADSFDVDLTPPGVPVLTAVTPDPTNNQRPVLAWSAVSGAADYRVQVSADMAFATTLFDVTVATTSWTPTANLPEGAIYWRALSRDSLANESAFSAADSFTIDITPPEAPTLNPQTPDPTNNQRPTFTWNAVDGAAEYLFFANTNNEQGGLISATVTGTSFTPSVDLPEGGIIWHVASRDALGNESGPSIPDTFTIDVTPPGVPVLIAVTPDPTNDRRPALSWGAVGGATDYHVQVSTDPGFATTLFDLNVGTASWAPTSDLPEGTIYWRASSRDALTNESAFPVADDFMIDITPPDVPVLVAVSPDPTTERRPSLSWGSVTGAADYRVQVSTDAAFASTLFDLNVSGTSWTPPSDLPEGTIFWRASSRDALTNESAFAAADDFEIDVTAPGIPTLTPQSPDPTQDLRPTLDWSIVTDAALYRIQISTDAGFGTTIVDSAQAGASFTPASDLPEGPIFWRVSSLDALSNESAFSAVDDFVIDVTAPVAIAGVVRSWDDASSWTLYWQPAQEGDFAFYAIYREAAPFTDTTGLTPIDTSIIDPASARFVDPAPLPDQDGHYAVVAVDAAGNALSAVQSIQAPGPAPLFADSFESGDLTGWTSVVQ